MPLVLWMGKEPASASWSLLEKQILVLQTFVPLISRLEQSVLVSSPGSHPCHQTSELPAQALQFPGFVTLGKQLSLFWAHVYS